MQKQATSQIKETKKTSTFFRFGGLNRITCTGVLEYEVLPRVGYKNPFPVLSKFYQFKICTYRVVCVF